MIPNPDFAARGWTAYVWNNSVGGGAEDLAYRMANAGYKVVLVPVSNNYLDMAWNKNPEERGLDWGGYAGLEKPFAFLPFDYYRNTRYDYRGNPVDPAVFVGKDRLTDYGRANVVGLEGALWSETLGGDGRLDYMLVPKIFGLAERAWAPDPAWAGEKDPAKSDALVPRGVLRVRERRRQARAAAARARDAGLELPDPEAGAEARRRPGEGQPRDPGLRPALHDRRHRADRQEPGAARADSTRAQLRVAAFDANGRKGHTAKLVAP